MTLNSDLNLESAYLSHDCCAPSRRDNIWPKFNKDPSSGKGGMERPLNSRVNSMTCKCDLRSEQLSHGFCTPTH